MNPALWGVVIVGVLLVCAYLFGGSSKRSGRGQAKGRISTGDPTADYHLRKLQAHVQRRSRAAARQVTRANRQAKRSQPRAGTRSGRRR